MERIYRALLRLYPYDFRIWFGAEMAEAFGQSSADLRLLGRWDWFRFALAEVAGLAAGAATEWCAKGTGDRIARARSLPDWRMMRPAGVSKELWFGKVTRCSSDT